MSAHTTIRVTRSKAKLVLMTWMMQADDQALEDLMDVYLDDQLFNCRIVPDQSENDDSMVR